MLEATVLVVVFGGRYWEVQDSWVGHLYYPLLIFKIVKLVLSQIAFLHN